MARFRRGRKRRVRRVTRRVFSRRSRMRGRSGLRKRRIKIGYRM